MRIETGNAGSGAARVRRQGWFGGHFIDNRSVLHSRDVEIKWGVHAAGDCKNRYVVNQHARTVSVLVRGRFRLFFRQGHLERDVVLEREGDYAAWDAGVAHRWTADLDCVVLTVRWPSLPGDQVLC